MSDTIYIRNINEKISRNKVVAELERVFKPLGPITHVYCSQRNVALKGQAWVTFTSAKAADKAVATMNTEYLFDKPMDIYRAKYGSYDKVKKDKGEKKVLALIASRKQQLQEQPKKAKVEKSKYIDNKQPNKVLLVQGIPKPVTQQQLESLFEGCVEVKLVRVRDVALVEYESEKQAAEVLKKLGKVYPMGEENMYITFAKK